MSIVYAICQRSAILKTHHHTSQTESTMSKSSDIVQWSNQPRLLVKILLIGALILFLLGSNSAEAKPFTGTVTNNDGEVLHLVLVDVFGPRKIATRTDKDGKFVVDLVSGKYTFRLRYNGRRKEFPYEISDDPNPQAETFKLNW